MNRKLLHLYFIGFTAVCTGLRLFLKFASVDPLTGYYEGYGAVVWLFNLLLLAGIGGCLLLGWLQPRRSYLPVSRIRRMAAVLVGVACFPAGVSGLAAQSGQLEMLQGAITMPALIAGQRRKDAFARAMELIDYLGLSARASHRPAELSGGERQRAAVARALVNRPEVVLADEPSGSLDTRNRMELHHLFFDLRRDLGQTFVIVTHDESLAADSDRVVHMTDGVVGSITDGKGD